MARQNDNAPPLPQNIEAERAVLGGILLDDSTLETVSGLVSADFSIPENRTIFTAIRAMQSKQQRIDLVTICEFMSTQHSLGLAGGAPYISSLIDGVPHISNLAHYSAIVKEKARLRAIITHAQQIQLAAFNPSATSEDIKKQLQLNLSSIQTG